MAAAVTPLPALGTTTEPSGTATPRAIPPRVRAVVQDQYGGVEVLALGEVETPAIGPREVLVRVRAAGLDRGTWHLMTGKPYLMRIMGFGVRAPKRRVPGIDVAGTVEAIGAEVTRFAVGDDVFGIGRGTYAEYAVAEEEKLSLKPAHLSFEQAAVVPVSAMTAIQALDTGRVESGQRVLIIGASGGVGTYAVQLAKAFGADVTAVCSAAKADFVRSLGADGTVDYAMQDFADGSQRYDLILDIGGNSSLRRLRRALLPSGSLVIVGGEAGGSVTGGFGRQLRALAISPFIGQRLTMVMCKEHHLDLDRLAELLDAGAIAPALDVVYPLARVADAMRRLESGGVRGKVAITP